MLVVSEIALALVNGVPVVGLDSWAVDGVQVVDSAELAARRALELAEARRGGPHT